MAERRTVEIDEAELLANQKLKGTVEAMLKDPTARRHLFAANKVVNPNFIPPTDYQDEVRQEIATEREARLKLEKQLAEERAAREAEKKTQEFTSGWDRQKLALRQQGYLDETIAEIEKLATERGIPDLEAAEALYARSHPPAQLMAPRSAGFSVFDPPAGDQADYVKKLIEGHGDAPVAEAKMVQSALEEVRMMNRRAA